MRLGVSPAAASTPTGVLSQRLLGFISPCWNPGLHSLSLSPFVPPGLSVRECGTALSASCHLAGPTATAFRESSLPDCPSPSLLPIWMNVSSLTPWLLDFYTVRFSVTSGCCLFLNLLFFFWLCEEAQCVCLRLHLG